ncbi:hypothetical protein SLEP1_g31508 [Rubroshorea leprosula]|uniref:Uncharacterized protein n=1 Tax=Rubroshorea leprosula TaxID=152421 RepID=A0AAV5KAV9_9ROSI|nr:hypothetical protein SLEP1_g31508 [Rubroshorea leprosula]
MAASRFGGSILKYAYHLNLTNTTPAQFCFSRGFSSTLFVKGDSFSMKIVFGLRSKSKNLFVFTCIKKFCFCCQEIGVWGVFSAGEMDWSDKPI